MTSSSVQNVNQDKSASSHSKTVLSKLMASHTAVNSTSDDSTLLDIHVGNPLRKITQLLEDLKKQKAFSFTFKGSLGIMGVVFSLSLLGLFGSNKVLCNKGQQTHAGTVKVLQVLEPDSLIPILSDVMNAYTYFFFHTVPPAPKNRVVLMTSYTEGIINIIAPSSIRLDYLNKKSMIITGEYDACGKQLTISDANAIEPNE